MKFLPFLALSWLHFSIVSGQEAMHIAHSCNFAADDSLAEVYTYAASKEARDIVERIMQMNVLPQNFIIKSADCNNALATTIGKQRFILYSTAFLENFKKEANTKWAAYCVLAHEIGHHLSNHDLEETNPAIRKRYELEADKFAGGILFRLGATLEEAQAGINTFSLTSDSKTHPPKRARLEALAVGWKQAEELSDGASNNQGSAAGDSDEKKLYNRAVAEKDAPKSIELLDQAIELKGDYADAYLERAKRKAEIAGTQDIRANYHAAIEDYDIYIQMRPKNAAALVGRGDAYVQLRRDTLALADYNRAIRLDAKNTDAYFSRAVVKMMTAESAAALKDLDKAVQLRPDFADAYFLHGNIQYGFGENEKALTALNKALQADSNHYYALNLRASVNRQLDHFVEAIADFNRLQALGPAKFEGYFDRGLSYQALGKHRQAIADFDKLLKDNPESAQAYAYRGASKQVLGQTAEAQKDYDLAFAHTSLKLTTSLHIGCTLIAGGLLKEGLVWLEAVLVEQPDNEWALACKAKALKK